MEKVKDTSSELKSEMLMVGFLVQECTFRGVPLLCMQFTTQALNFWSRLSAKYLERYKGIGIVFVFDSNQVDLLEKPMSTSTNNGMDVFRAVLAMPGFEKCPLCVLFNKQDLPTASSVEYLIDRFKIEELHGRNVIFRGCSALTGQGLTESLNSLLDMMDPKSAPPASDQ